jgi:iron-sulfur cluster repair protein YtfE (RIC family)
MSHRSEANMQTTAETTPREETFIEVRRRISAEHTVIMAELARLADAANRVVERDPRGPIALREALWDVYTRLVDHLAMEENHLVPLLEKIDSWGPYRVTNLLEEHRQQRVVLDAIIDECECGTKDDLELADDAQWLVDSISKDILLEENGLDAIEENDRLEICAE